ncbi:MAG: hypothetical protein AB7O74_06570 [Candidatus Nanopelagicales bacterium]
MNGDGRLDLDDLGGVIEHASSIDEPVDVVGEEPARTWGERLERAGITPWLRRHRAAVAASTAAVLVVAIGATAWVRAQPPPWHEPAYEMVPATLTTDSGTSVRTLDDGTAMAAYLVRSEDPGATIAIDAIEGPGIRASSVGAPLATGNPRARLVRAVLGCDDDSLTSTPDQYRMRLTATDAWGRSATTFAAIPSGGASWREAVIQNCWQQAIATSVKIGDVEAVVDEGSGALGLEVTLTSSIPGEVQASLEAFGAETAIVPTGYATTLPPGAVTTVSGRLDVWDCSGGTPPVPTIAMPEDPTSQRYTRMVEGVGLQVFSPDRQAWGVTAVAFTPAQSAEVRRGLASVCAGAPDVAVGSMSVVRSTTDEAIATTSLTLVMDVDVPAGRLAQVGITQDPVLGYPDPSRSVWTLAPRGGGRAEATWTFTCFSAPTPPALDVRFVDGIRPTPVRVPLDQETLAPWVTDACPQLTPELLVEQGWQLP